MGRIVLASDNLSTYLTNLANQNSTVVGLILGQSCLGKDHVIHFAKTSFFKKDEEPLTSDQKLESVVNINENIVADHVRQVTRMLPGGIYVLGIFIVSSEDVLNTFNPKIKSILLHIYKQFSSNKYLYGNHSDEKLVINYCTKSKKFSCKSYNISNFNTQPADLQFLPQPSKWVYVECELEIDHLRYLQKTESDWHLQKHFQVILNKLHDSLDTAMYFFGGEFRDADEYLDSTDNKKKTRGKRSQKGDVKDDQNSNKPIKVSIFQTKHSSCSDNYSVLETCGQLRIVGQVACRLWLQPKLTIKEASEAVKQDILRSLASRLEMHWDSLTEEENSEDINCVHEPPRRVLIELPNNSITLSDYLFPGEGPQDAKASLEELLDIKIKGKLKIQDVEGQADISQFYDTALETEKTEILQKLSKDSNKFIYIAAIFGVVVLLISILLHFCRN